ncbi:hypothetical protein [Pirellula sp. SH-Sr6A]|nr:hypothetical protein [Pirellula sp. SH-Sr6A]
MAADEPIANKMMHREHGTNFFAPENHNLRIRIIFGEVSMPAAV